MDWNAQDEPWILSANTDSVVATSLPQHHRFHRGETRRFHKGLSRHQKHGPLGSHVQSLRFDKTVTWQQLKPTIETGDIILFSGQSVLSTAIKVAEGMSHWSHCAMFYVDKDGNVYIWESTNPDGQRDVFNQTLNGGVRLLLAETALRFYLDSAANVEIITRQLFINRKYIGHGLVDPVSRLPELWKLITATEPLPYEKDLVELARVELPVLQLLYAWHSQDSYFCSELIAQAYMALGLLPDKPPERDGILGKIFFRHSGLYSPADFSQESQDLPFLYDTTTNENLVGLGPHLRIVFTDRINDRRNNPLHMAHASRPHLRMEPFDSGSSKQRYV